MNTIRTFRNALESFDSELLSPFTVGFDRTFDRLWDYANHSNSTTNYPRIMSKNTKTINL